MKEGEKGRAVLWNWRREGDGVKLYHRRLAKDILGMFFMLA